MPKTWVQLGVPLHEQVSQAIASLNFPTMTPVQAATIPQFLHKKDVVAEAVTGSGKTLAFLIPILEILKRHELEEKWKRNQIGALIISPTRELALQTHHVLKQLLEHVPDLKQLLLVGGNTIEDDVNNIKNSHCTIIICTPGRFVDLLTRKNDINLGAALKSLEVLVLDEADRLLDLGFRSSLDTIFSYLPRQRRTGLFSATQTQQVQDLIRAGLRNPVLVSVSAKAEQSTPETLDNYYLVVKDDAKLAALLTFLRQTSFTKGMLFLPTCACVDYWGKALPLLSDVTIPILAMHGKMKEKRAKILKKFKGMEKGLLLCTDVLARGIDITDMDWVLQWEPPSSVTSFVHRVGRTARQGRGGSSLLLLTEMEEAYIHFIEKNQRVTLEPYPGLPTHFESDKLRDALRAIQKTDRDIMEKGIRAFVSHVRAYSKHECNLLLRVQDLPLGGLASTYGLMQMPKMPELKNRDVSSFQPEDSYDVNSIQFRDKQREKARLLKLQQYKSTGLWPGKKIKIKGKETEPWALSKQKKTDKKARKLKRQQAKAAKSDTNPKKRKGISEEDMAELAKDIALMKKLKKNKISEETFDKEFGID